MVRSHWTLASLVIVSLIALAVAFATDNETSAANCNGGCDTNNPSNQCNNYYIFRCSSGGCPSCALIGPSCPKGVYNTCYTGNLVYNNKNTGSTNNVVQIDCTTQSDCINGSNVQGACGGIFITGCGDGIGACQYCTGGQPYTITWANSCNDLGCSEGG